MQQQFYIGNFGKGLRDDVTAFNIDNDAFPFLFNTYVWRERVKRKRGTVYLGQLALQVSSVSSPSSPWQDGPITVTGGTANLLTFVGASSGASIVPGTINLTVGGTLYTDPTSNGILSGGSGGTINYSTGVAVFTGEGNTTGIGTFSYYPGLPVMGLRDFTAPDALSNYPDLLAFDTTYAYQCTQADVNTRFFNVSYFKQTGNPVTWTGQNYQQFWSTNYPSTTTNQSGAFWATNNVPGFHFASIIAITMVSATQVTMTITSSGLIPNDVIWINEVTGTIATGSGSTQNQNINGQTGYVVSVTPGTPDTVTVNFNGTNGSSTANFQAGATGTGGIAQYLTSNAKGTGDGIRWYDGDMTSQTGIPTSTTTGWVNFAPPLTATSVSINGLPSARYYLVGALAILPFKDYFLFFSPYVQTSTGSPIQLQDTVIWSQQGTPFYNALVPKNQTYVVSAYYVDKNASFLSAGISQPIQTVTNNEDVLLIGFGGNGRKTRFAYTGNAIDPFLFYNINSELPSTSTFSSVTLDKGAIDIGSFGICMTDQQSSQRIDLDIPNAVFQIQKDNNGSQRVNAIRDYINEWIYFCYPVDNSGTDSQEWVFPTQTFFFNYRDNTWAVFYENFTTHGQYRANSNLTWATLPYTSWSQWTDPWNTGTETAFEIQVIAGNPQGYVLVKGVGTDEGLSGTISAMQDAGNGYTQITSYNHCLQSSNPNTFTTDFIYIQNCLGVTALNNQAFAVVQIIDENNFVINGNWPGGNYLGAGQFSRLSQPYFQTKQFPVFWNDGRQVRIGVQRYLLDTTASGQVTLQIFLSQNDNDPWNNPNFSGTPNGLEYSQVLYTCPESTNLGLTPANVNLQQLVTSANQYWHRVNTSLIGDTFQIGITLSDDQMQDINLATDEIVLHGMQFTIAPGPLLS